MYHNRFERTFATTIGVPYASSVSQCTHALHLSLAALGIGPGDEVIVPDVTWIASAAPVQYVGATLVFADIDPATWCVTADSLAACLSPRTRAVIAVDLYGSMPDYDTILAFCQAHRIHLIEDAAEAIGSQYHGRQAGSFGITGCFSFHGSKTITTGEGGMIVTPDEALFARINFLRDHGRVPGDRFFQNAEVAFKYKMSSMQAAMGLAQIERLDEIIERKRQIFQWYADRLGAVDGVALNAEPEGVLNSYWMNTVVVDASFGLDKFALQAKLEARQIDTRPFFSPLSSLKAFSNDAQATLARQRNRVSYDVAGRALNLPSALMLTEEQVDKVCADLRDILHV